MSQNQFLNGAWEKVKRADENILSLEAEIDAYVESRPIEFVADGCEYAGSKKYAKWRVTSVKAMPDLFSVLTGEIIHHLRSSLDLM